MIIKHYGITLRRVEKRDIELIRKWRNSKSIQDTMLYKEYISKEMQLEWFNNFEKSINNVYYLIILKNKKTGLISVKNIYSESSEAGLFMFNNEYHNTYIPVIASIILLEISLLILKEFNSSSFIKVLKTNKKAVNYNKSLGYYIIDDSNKEYYKMKITEESFKKSTKKIIKAVKYLYDNTTSEFILKPIDYKLGLNKKYKTQIKKIEKIALKKQVKHQYLRLVLDL